MIFGGLVWVCLVMLFGFGRIVRCFLFAVFAMWLIRVAFVDLVVCGCLGRGLGVLDLWLLILLCFSLLLFLGLVGLLHSLVSAVLVCVWLGGAVDLFCDG